MQEGKKSFDGERGGCNMKTRARESIVWILARHFFWLGLLLFIYRNTLFCSMEGLSLPQSRGLLIGLTIGMMLISIIVNWKQGTGMWDTLINILPGFCIYTLLTYHQLAPDLVFWVSVLTIAVCVLYAVMRLIPTIDHPKRRAAIMIKRIKGAFCGVYRLLTMGGMLLIGILAACSIFKVGMFGAGLQAAVPSRDNKITMQSEMNTLIKMEKSTWTTLSPAERIDVLQTVANIEACYLGLPHELQVTAANMEDEKVNADYLEKEHRIRINLKHLVNDGGRSLLNSVCHEARHAYQYKLVQLFDKTENWQKELLLFDDVRQYKYEFKHYIGADGDVTEYRNQYCETDARNYAQKMTAIYAERIIDYLHELDENGGRENREDVA